MGPIDFVNCIVTAGPTFETLDQVRRLTNFSTGKLGSSLAGFLSGRGHQVILLRGASSTWTQPVEAKEIDSFTTTKDLSERLAALSSRQVDAVFHAAAVSDFRFGRAFVRDGSGNLHEVQEGKLSTRLGPLLVELLPTPKVISNLRSSFPGALLIGWKYEVDGVRDQAVASGLEQVRRCNTDACVVNGPAYGKGFGFITPSEECVHLADETAMFEKLAQFIEA